MNFDEKKKQDEKLKTQPVKDEEPSWAENAKEDLGEFIESRGIYIRQ